VDIKWIRNGERQKKRPELEQAMAILSEKEPFGSTRKLERSSRHMVFLELRNLSEVFVPHTFLQAYQLTAYHLPSFLFL
jgi:hypothetical protein